MASAASRRHVFGLPQAYLYSFGESIACVYRVFGTSRDVFGMLCWSAPCEGDSVNQALRSAMLAAGLEHLDLSAQLSVDPKTVERWLSGRLPHPRNRAAIAKLVGRTADELWPSTSDTNRRGRLGGEVRAIYPSPMGRPA